MSVRPADVNDMPHLMRIEDDCFGAERFSAEVVRAFLEREDTFVLVAERDGDIVGSAMAMTDLLGREGRIASIAVLSSHRRRGVGSELLVEIEGTFQRNKLARYTLEVETTNDSAIALYRSRGYNIMGIVRDFYGPGRPAYFMEKKAARGRRLRIGQA